MPDKVSCCTYPAARGEEEEGKEWRKVVYWGRWTRQGWCNCLCQEQQRRFWAEHKRSTSLKYNAGSFDPEGFVSCHTTRLTKTSGLKRPVLYFKLCYVFCSEMSLWYILDIVMILCQMAGPCVFSFVWYSLRLWSLCLQYQQQLRNQITKMFADIEIKKKEIEEQEERER